MSEAMTIVLVFVHGVAVGTIATTAFFNWLWNRCGNDAKEGPKGPI